MCECCSTESNGLGVNQVYDKLLKRRTIMLTCEVDEDSITDIIAFMLELQNEDAEKPIELIVSSWGGSLDMGLALYDVMKSLSCPVNTTAMGKACSAGALILAAGTGVRKVYPSTRVMIHQPSGGMIFGTITDNEINRANDIAWKKIFLEALAESVGKEYKTVKRDCERDKWMSAEDAVKYGLADEVVALTRLKKKAE